MTERPALIPIDELVALLRDRVDMLARELLPAGHRDNREWREARKDQGGLGDSLSVHIAGGARRGVWAHHAAGQSGDVLDLVAYLRTNGDKKKAIEWAKAWLGIAGADRAALDAKRAPPARHAEEEARAAQDVANRRANAHAIYLSAGPIDGSPVAAYLRGRGLAIERLGFPLRALRYHPGLWDRHTKRRWPAMVAAVTGMDGQFLAVHQTYLEALGNGAVRKAPIADEAGSIANKRVFGSYRGGTIRLWRGTRVDPKTGEIKQARRLADCKGGEWVDITEGIEDGLTVALAINEARVLVGISASNMASIRLPDCVEGVALWRQNDAPGSAAARALDKAVAAFQAQGKRVADCRPPDGVKDANDMLQAANGVRPALQEQAGT